MANISSWPEPFFFLEPYLDLKYFNSTSYSGNMNKNTFGALRNNIHSVENIR